VEEMFYNVSQQRPVVIIIIIIIIIQNALAFWFGCWQGGSNIAFPHDKISRPEFATASLMKY
jgi:hypothetical protein